jgi:catechol 2,3-dioxygenase-like lactoylglutathione lyase family enzyme
MPQRLALTALLVREYDEAIDFYVRRVGFALVEDSDMGDGKRWVVVRPPGGQGGLLLARAVNAIQTAQVGAQGGGRVWLFLQTPDFDRDHAAMTAAGAESTLTAWRPPETSLISNLFAHGR